MTLDYLSPESLIKAGITWEELSAIEQDFEKKLSDYEQAAHGITNVLLKTAGVHSVRYRVKNPKHLLKKVVRKRCNDKERVIDLENYEREITDLAGVRVLHLFKSDWLRIHRFITENWNLYEEPTAYYREGDSAEVLTLFKKLHCAVKPHPFGYRSVHYLVKTHLTRATRVVEIQVRTIFEEGWSEVDHTLRYPDFSDDPLTTNLLSLLNRLAGSADEMSSYVQALHEHLTASKDEVTRLRQEHDEKVEQMQRVIDELNLSTQDKSKLQGAAESLGKGYGFDFTIRNVNDTWKDWLSKYQNSIENSDPTTGSGDLIRYIAYHALTQGNPGNSSEDEDDDGEKKPNVKVQP